MFNIHSVDEKTNAVFNEFLRYDRSFDSVADHGRLSGTKSPYRRHLHHRHHHHHHRNHRQLNNTTTTANCLPLQHQQLQHSNHRIYGIAPPTPSSSWRQRVYCASGSPTIDLERTGSWGRSYSYHPAGVDRQQQPPQNSGLIRSRTTATDAGLSAHRTPGTPATISLQGPVPVQSHLHHDGSGSSSGGNLDLQQQNATQKSTTGVLTPPAEK